MSATVTADKRQLSLRSPSKIKNEPLAALVIEGCQQFKRVIPYVIELQKRFKELPRGNANIAGCKTWEEFCKKKLDRTRQAVHKALAAYNEKAAAAAVQKTNKPKIEKPTKELKELADAIPPIRNGNEFTKPSEYSAADVVETVTKMISNLAAHLTAPDKKIAYRSIIRELEDLLKEMN